MSFDLSAIKQMEAYANFGKAVIELAKEQEIIPKRQLRKIVVREKLVVRTRKPRRTKAQIAQAQIIQDVVGSKAVTVGVPF